MGSSPVVLLTYNHEALMKSFGPMVPPQVQAVLKATGLDGTRLVGLRLGAKGRALVGTLFIQTHGERRGLLKALAAAPIDKALLKLAPRDARIAWATNVDPTELYDATVAAIHAVAASVDMEGIDVLGGIRAFEAKAGLSLRDDLFGALNRGTVVTTSGGSILIPALIVSQGAKDADRFEATLGKLVGQLDAVIKEAKGPGSGAALRTIEFRGHTIRYLATPMVPVPLAPCYTRLGGRIVFALTPVHLKDYLVFLDKGEPSVLDHPDCRKLVALVPANATSLAYSDAGEGFVQLYGMFAPMLASVAQAIPNSPVPIDLVNLPSKRVLRKHLFGAISYSFATKDTIVFESQSPFGVSVLGPAPAGAAALASTAVLAGMLLPALARAREEARLIRNRNYLNQIAKGCAVYLNEHGDNRFYPSGIAELVDKGVIRDKKILVSPLDRAPPKLANGVPCSFVSCFDKYPDRVFRDDFPPNIMMAWDRISFARGQRSVLFFDSHVELVDEWRFERLLKELDELVKKNTTPRKGAKKKGQRI